MIEYARARTRARVRRARHVDAGHPPTAGDPRLSAGSSPNERAQGHRFPGNDSPTRPSASPWIKMLNDKVILRASVPRAKL